MFRYVILLGLLIPLVGCQTTRSTGNLTGFAADDVVFNDLLSTKDKGRLGAGEQPIACQPNLGGGVFAEPSLDVPEPTAITGLAFDSRSGALLLRTARDIRVWDVLQGQQRAIRALSADQDFSSSLAWPGGGINLNVNAKLGAVDVFSGKDGALLASIWLTSKAWAVVDRQGRFDAAPRHFSDFHWRSGDDSLSFMQLADGYYEPALLGKLASGAKFDTADVQAIDSGIALPPQTELSVQLSDDASQVFGTIKVTRRGGCIGKVRVFHNEKAIAAQTPDRFDPNADGQIWRFSTPVQSGRQQFRALASNAKKIEGAPALAQVQVGEQVFRQPQLHVLVVGIDHYVNPALRLDFAVADGEGVVAWANSLPSGPQAEFEKVTVTRVYDKQATRPGILRQLQALQRVGMQDTVLIFLAGHGENDGERWYFLPAEFGRDVSFEAIAAEGISAQALQKALVRIPARRIALVVDACKSGDLRRVFSAATDSRYLEWVSRTAGVRLLAATDQEQLAVELPELGHGALTYSLLQGLSGEADVSPGNRVVMAGELFQYAEHSLPEITQRIAGESQYPTVFEYGADFPLARF